MSNHNSNSIKSKVPSESDLYYEYSFRKHCYKFEREDVGYICATHENKEVALNNIIKEIRERLNKTSKS